MKFAGTSVLALRAFQKKSALSRTFLPFLFAKVRFFLYLCSQNVKSLT